MQDFEAMCKRAWSQPMRNACQANKDKPRDVEGIVEQFRGWKDDPSQNTEEQATARHKRFWELLPQVPDDTDVQAQTELLQSLQCFFPRDDQASWLSWDADAAAVWDKKQQLEGGGEPSPEKLSQGALRQEKVLEQVTRVADAAQDRARAAAFQNCRSALVTLPGARHPQLLTIDPSQNITVFAFLRQKCAGALQDVAPDDMVVSVTGQDGKRLEFRPDNDPQVSALCTGAFPAMLQCTVDVHRAGDEG